MVKWHESWGKIVRYNVTFFTEDWEPLERFNVNMVDFVGLNNLVRDFNGAVARQAQSPRKATELALAAHVSIEAIQCPIDEPASESQA